MYNELLANYTLVLESIAEAESKYEELLDETNNENDDSVLDC